MSDQQKQERLAEPARALRQEYDETLRLARATAAHALRVGELLREARALVPHREWGKWIHGNFPGDLRTAQEWMLLIACAARRSAGRACLGSGRLGCGRPIRRTDRQSRP
jgi:hypothetical protein